MRQQAPSLLVILRPAPNIIAARQHPNHPPGLLRRQVLRQTLRVRKLPRRVVVQRKAPLRQHDREMVDRGVARVERLEAVCVQAALERRAAGDGVLVVVDLQHDLVGGEVVEGEGPAAGGEGGPLHDGGEVGVEVEAGKEDERVWVCVVDGGGTLLHVLVPGLPVVGGFGGFAIVGGAELVAQRHGGQSGP